MHARQGFFRHTFNEGGRNLTLVLGVGLGLGLGLELWFRVLIHEFPLDEGDDRNGRLG